MSRAPAPTASPSEGAVDELDLFRAEYDQEARERAERELDRVFIRAQVVDDLAELEGLREALESSTFGDPEAGDVWVGLYEDFEAELDFCTPPLLSSPRPNRATRRRHGVYFDPDEVVWAVNFCAQCTLTEGRWEGQRFIPDLWQVLYVLAPIFGWRRKDGTRLYRTLYLEVPRKNGKSTLCAALALLLLMADRNARWGSSFEAGAQIFSAASDLDQARLVFAAAEKMVKQSPRLANALGLTKDLIEFDRALAIFKPLSGAAAIAENKMGLNPSGQVIDELHTIDDRRLVDTLESATGSRDQPLTIIITTAGSDARGTIYDEKRRHAEKVAKGSIDDPAFYGAIYTVPEELLSRWDDVEVIRRANPGFGRSPTEAYFEDVLPQARNSEQKRNAFCRLHLNVRTGSLTRWVPMDVVRSCGMHVRPSDEDLRYLAAFGGLDLASSRDLAAAAFVVPRWVDDPADPEYEIEALDLVLRAWVPLGSMEKRDPAEAALFGEWIEQGVLTGHEGEVLDYDAIESDLIELADWLSIDRLHFDRWGSKQIIGHLSDGGLNVLEMGQGFASMSPPMKQVERLLFTRRLRTGGNPLFLYAMEGLRVVTDANGNIKPDREKSTTRIDPFVASVMAVDGWMRADRPQRSAYEDHGVTIA